MSLLLKNWSILSLCWPLYEAIYFFFKVILKTSLIQVLGQVRKPNTKLFIFFLMSVASIEFFTSSLPYCGTSDSFLLPRGALFSDHFAPLSLGKHPSWMNVRPWSLEEQKSSLALKSCCKCGACGFVVSSISVGHFNFLAWWVSGVKTLKYIWHQLSWGEKSK